MPWCDQASESSIDIEAEAVALHVPGNLAAAPAAGPDKQISLRPVAIIAFIIIFLVLVSFIAKAWGASFLAVSTEDLPTD